MMHARHEYIEQNNKLLLLIKWKALISFIGERKRKEKYVGGKKEKKKKFVCLQPPRL